ncbi:MAG: NmrA family NAD(P)-binding protein [Bacteroidales bacterium]|nr:NmrA family NAD(P)-binding protein [Bacteroidales bacterium]
MDAIKKSGMAFTFIKANFFMQNFGIYQVEDIKNRNQIFLPTGEGRAPFIHTQDIGEVAAAIPSNSGSLQG